MGSLKAEDKELDDSGYVQDDGPQKSSPEKRKLVNLLDLSDDVLLCILKHCGPLDLKALGFTCTRLASVVRDRSLWQTVDARAAPHGARRVRWLLAHALHAGTSSLLLRGHAASLARCNGYHNVNRPKCCGGTKDNDSDKPGRCAGLADRTYPDHSRVSILWPEEELDKKRVIINPKSSRTEPSTRATKSSESDSKSSETDSKSSGTDSKSHETDSKSSETDSKSSGTDSKSNKSESSSNTEANTSKASNLQESKKGTHMYKDPNCPGPKFTLTPCLLRQLRAQCSLTTLGLDYCNINCARISLSQFPRQLTQLSLRGSLCYNMSLNKSLLFQIQEHLPHLEHLDLSECTWLDASCMLPLSKLENLRTLLMTHCPKLREFVAYASISARYGFRKLKVFDLRGSPLGDSEVAALGWLPELEELYLCATKEPGKRQKHNHFADDVLPYVEELSDWELQEPEYFKSLLKQKNKRTKEKLDDNDRCCHGLPFNQCLDGLGGYNPNKSPRDLKRSARKGSEEPGPSKRKKPSHSDDDDEESDEDMNEETPDNSNSETNEENGDNGEVSEGNNGDNDNENREGNEANGQRNGENGAHQLIELRPMAHILYVNVGQQLNNPIVHRLVNLNEPFNEDLPDHQMVDPSELVTDTAIRSFGHSDDDNINYFHIGGLPHLPNLCRPNKSSLKILSLNGYKSITDKSLKHLSTSAPKLEKIDFSRTSVTENGVEFFKISRPEVEIVYSPFVNLDSNNSCGSECDYESD